MAVESKAFEEVSETEDATHESIIPQTHIYEDNQDNLWLGTHEEGAYKFNGKTFEKFRS